MMDKPEICRAERDEKRITMVIMGIAVPLICLWFAQDAWLSEVAKWPLGRGSYWQEVEGPVAKCLGLAYLGIAVVFASRWVLRHARLHGLALCAIVLGSLIFFAGVTAGLVFMA